MHVRRWAALVAAGVALFAAAACEDRGALDPATPTSVAVHATDTECRLDRSQVTPGSVVFGVTNDGAKVTEFYVYGDGGQVIDEVENIGPGVRRELKVDLAAGTYTTACKPGMTGDGIRTTLKVS